MRGNVVMPGLMLVVQKVCIGEGLEPVAIRVEPDVEYMATQWMPTYAPVGLPTSRQKPPVSPCLSLKILRFKGNMMEIGLIRLGKKDRMVVDPFLPAIDPEECHNRMVGIAGYVH